MKTYLINLDRSPERLAFFRQQATRVGITFERTAAIDGRSLPESTWKSIVDEQFEFQPMNIYEVAVFLSHKAIWERMLRDGVRMAAIFEDDVLLAPHTAKTLTSIEQSTFPFDLVKIETTLRSVVLSNSKIALSSGESLQRLKSWHGGAAGYVVSLEGAKKLSHLTDRIADQIDQVLFNPLSRISSTLTIFQCVPAICVQKDLQHRGQPATFESTIERSNTRGKWLRHGIRIDLQRMLKKFRQKRLAHRLALLPENTQTVVAMAAETAESKPLKMAA